VTPSCHAIGSEPGESVSKLTVSALAADAAKIVATAMHDLFT
jgi:hypothetical protein